MKKILIVFNHQAPYKVRFFNELTKYFDVTVIFERNYASDRDKKFYTEKNFLFKSIKIKGLNIGRENFISSGIVKFLKKNTFDLILMNGYSTFAEMRTIRYLKRNKIPYLLYINGGIINKTESSLKRKIKTKYISGAKAYLSPDESSNSYLEYYGANKDKIFLYPYSTIYENEIINNPVSLLEKQKDRNANEKITFISAGQFIERKNFFTIISSWKNMPNDYHLYIYGDGKLYEKNCKFVNDFQLNNVHLHRFLKRNELLEKIQKADIFIFPSKEDIYGHVVNEAMSQGVPVISNTNVNAAKKLITNNLNGYITNDFSADNILKISKSLLQDKIQQKCIETAKENTIEKMGKIFADNLMELLK